ncbi:MAG: antA/AntB antirepressor family protein [Candidatus Phlomobacter fragariae]
MQNLINIKTKNINGELIQTVNARDLHSFLEIGKDFTTWIKNSIKQYGFVEGDDFIIVENLSSPRFWERKIPPTSDQGIRNLSIWLKSYQWLSVMKKANRQDSTLLNVKERN